MNMADTANKTFSERELLHWWLNLPNGAIITMLLRGDFPSTPSCMKTWTEIKIWWLPLTSITTGFQSLLRNCTSRTTTLITFLFYQSPSTMLWFIYLLVCAGTSCRQLVALRGGGGYFITCVCTLCHATLMRHSNTEPTPNRSNDSDCIANTSKILHDFLLSRFVRFRGLPKTITRHRSSSCCTCQYPHGKIFQKFAKFLACVCAIARRSVAFLCCPHVKLAVGLALPCFFRRELLEYQTWQCHQPP